MSDDLILKQRFIRFLEKDNCKWIIEKNNILNNPELLKISSLDIPLDIAEIAEEFINDELNMEKEEKYLLKDLLRHKKNRDKKPVDLYKLLLVTLLMCYLTAVCCIVYWINQI